ncbi:MAG: hypothetical protein ACREX9_15530 [Gammaproteobacteria bacterium]
MPFLEQVERFDAKLKVRASSITSKKKCSLKIQQLFLERRVGPDGTGAGGRQDGARQETALIPAQNEVASH